MLLHITQSLSSSNNNDHKLIYISSSKQEINMMTNICTITGNVIVKNGPVHIYSNRIIINFSNKKKEKKILESYGNQIIFFQFQKKRYPILGYSKKIRYEPDKNLLTITGNVCLKYLNNNIQGHHVFLFLNENKK